MLYSKIEEETGGYLARDGKRYDVQEALSVRPITDDWHWFNSMDECLEAWGLTYDPLPDSENAE